MWLGSTRIFGWTVAEWSHETAFPPLREFAADHCSDLRENNRC